jgi:hypothetical protein
VAGAYVKQGALVSTQYNTIDFVRTMEEVLGLPPMNLNDALARPMADIFNTTPSPWSFTAAPSAILYWHETAAASQPAGLSVPKPTHNAKYWARVTKGMDFSTEDRVDPAELQPHSLERDDGQQALSRRADRARPAPEPRDKTVAFVAQQIRASVGNLPVMFAIGNIDSYTGYGPDSTFLSNTADTFYSQFVNGSVDHQTFLNTFTSGGYYSAQPFGTHLVVIGLNTNVFALGVPGDNDAAVAAELAWLDSTLAAAQAAGQKVWLLMHVPPGANTVTTAGSLVNGQIVSGTMMMYQSYQASFLQILAKYPGVITMTLGAHTHMDEYRILSPSIVLDEVPAITPCFGENPAYKVFTLTQNTLTPTDYRSLNYDLAALPLPAQFNNYYTFSAAYSMTGPLSASLTQLYPQLATNIALGPAQPPNAQQALYIGQYNSGNTAWNVNANPTVLWNPVTLATWPVFVCGIGKMGQLDFEDCVNSY